MRYSGTLIVVKNKEESVRFYTETMGLSVACDFGESVVMSDGVYLQTADSWKKLLGLKRLSVGSMNELYFEEKDFDAFVVRLKNAKIKCKVKEERWGQRSVRFSDPNGHRIEVGENMTSVAKRLHNDGMSEKDIALKLDVPLTYVRQCLKS